jgi:hypothetical protein
MEDNSVGHCRSPCAHMGHYRGVAPANDGHRMLGQMCQMLATTPVPSQMLGGQYLAAWDVRRATLFGRCEPRSGIAPFGRLVAQVMRTEPYRSARRVFWIVDNGSSHRGQASVERLEGAYRNPRLIHLPIHASWLNQIEIYFSIVQRKVLTPNDFADLAAVEQRLLAFEERYETLALPFEWRFTRADLRRLMARLARSPLLGAAA